MKTTPKLIEQAAPTVTIDPALDVYRDQVLFPEKLAKANQMLKTAKLPVRKVHG
jgi:hypothetical protein